MFKSKRIIYIRDVKEMNQHIKYCQKYRLYAPSEGWVEAQPFKKNYYTMEILFTKLILRYRRSGFGYAEYIFHLDGSAKQQQVSGLYAFTMLQRLSNKGVDDLTGNWEIYNKNTDTWKYPIMAGLLWFNPKFVNQRIENCVEYDVNNAYSYAMTFDIPNTKVKPRENDFVKKGEIGFRVMQRGFNEEMYLYAVFEEGKYAQFIFPAIKSPFVKFAETYYNKRRNAKTPEEKEKIKQILNYSVGYIARKNPFLHSCILSRARYRIEDLIDLETTIYSNTDSIISMVKREDIESTMTGELGSFKINHQGSFAYTDSGYQWNFEVPSVRGKSKAWFKNAYPNGYDILVDKLPFVEANKYYYDEEEGVIKLCRESIKSVRD